MSIRPFFWEQSNFKRGAISPQAAADPLSEVYGAGVDEAVNVVVTREGVLRKRRDNRQLASVSIEGVDEARLAVYKAPKSTFVSTGEDLTTLSVMRGMITRSAGPDANSITVGFTGSSDTVSTLYAPENTNILGYQEAIGSTETNTLQGFILNNRLLENKEGSLKAVVKYRKRPSYVIAHGLDLVDSYNDGTTFYTPAFPIPIKNNVFLRKIVNLAIPNHNNPSFIFNLNQGILGDATIDLRGVDTIYVALRNHVTGAVGLAFLNYVQAPRATDERSVFWQVIGLGIHRPSAPTVNIDILLLDSRSTPPITSIESLFETEEATFEFALPPWQEQQWGSTEAANAWYAPAYGRRRLDDTNFAYDAVEGSEASIEIVEKIPKSIGNIHRNDHDYLLLVTRKGQVFAISAFVRGVRVWTGSFTIPNLPDENMLHEVRFFQDGNELLITHNSFPPYKLVITGFGLFILQEVFFNYPFSSFPAVASAFFSRRIFAGFVHAPLEIAASSIGYPLDFEVPTNPHSLYGTNAAASFRITIAEESQFAIRFILPAKDGLLVFTRAGIWQIGPTLLLEQTRIYPLDFEGAAELRPLQIESDFIYYERGKKQVSALQQQGQQGTFARRVLNGHALHLLNNDELTSWAWDPRSGVLWVSRKNSHRYLSLSLHEDTDVLAWTEHKVDNDERGKVVSFVSLREGDEDIIYSLVEDEDSFLITVIDGVPDEEDEGETAFTFEEVQIPESAEDYLLNISSIVEEVEIVDQSELLIIEGFSPEGGFSGDGTLLDYQETGPQGEVTIPRQPFVVFSREASTLRVIPPIELDNIEDWTVIVRIGDSDTFFARRLSYATDLIFALSAADLTCFAETGETSGGLVKRTSYEVGEAEIVVVVGEGEPEHGQEGSYYRDSETGRLYEKESEGQDALTPGFFTFKEGRDGVLFGETEGLRTLGSFLQSGQTTFTALANELYGLSLDDQQLLFVDFSELAHGRPSLTKRALTGVPTGRTISAITTVNNSLKAVDNLFGIWDLDTDGTLDSENPVEAPPEAPTTGTVSFTVQTAWPLNTFSNLWFQPINGPVTFYNDSILYGIHISSVDPGFIRLITDADLLLTKPITVTVGTTVFTLPVGTRTNSWSSAPAAVAFVRANFNLRSYLTFRIEVPVQTVGLGTDWSLRFPARNPVRDTSDRTIAIVPSSGFTTGHHRYQFFDSLLSSITVNEAGQLRFNANKTVAVTVLVRITARQTGRQDTTVIGTVTGNTNTWLGTTEFALLYNIFVGDTSYEVHMSATVTAEPETPDRTIRGNISALFYIDNAYYAMTREKNVIACVSGDEVIPETDHAYLGAAVVSDRILGVTQNALVELTLPIEGSFIRRYRTNASNYVVYNPNEVSKIVTVGTTGRDNIYRASWSFNSSVSSTIINFVQGSRIWAVPVQIAIGYPVVYQNTFGTFRSGVDSSIDPNRNLRTKFELVSRQKIELATITDEVITNGPGVLGNKIVGVAYNGTTTYVITTTAETPDLTSSYSLWPVRPNSTIYRTVVGFPGFWIPSEGSPRLIRMTTDAIYWEDDKVADIDPSHTFLTGALTAVGDVLFLRQYAYKLGEPSTETQLRTLPNKSRYGLTEVSAEMITASGYTATMDTWREICRNIYSWPFGGEVVRLIPNPPTGFLQGRIETLEGLPADINLQTYIDRSLLIMQGSTIPSLTGMVVRPVGSDSALLSFPNLTSDTRQLITTRGRTFSYKEGEWEILGERRFVLQEVEAGVYYVVTISWPDGTTTSVTVEAGEELPENATEGDLFLYIQTLISSKDPDTLSIGNDDFLVNGCPPVDPPRTTGHKYWLVQETGDAREFIYEVPWLIETGPQLVKGLLWRSSQTFTETSGEWTTGEIAVVWPHYFASTQGATATITYSTATGISVNPQQRFSLEIESNLFIAIRKGINTLWLPFDDTTVPYTADSSSLASFFDSSSVTVDIILGRLDQRCLNDPLNPWTESAALVPKVEVEAQTTRDVNGEVYIGTEGNWEPVSDSDATEVIVSSSTEVRVVSLAIRLISLSTGQSFLAFGAPQRIRKLYAEGFFEGPAGGFLEDSSGGSIRAVRGNNFVVSTRPNKSRDTAKVVFSGPGIKEIRTIGAGLSTEINALPVRLVK